MNRDNDTVECEHCKWIGTMTECNFRDEPFMGIAGFEAEWTACCPECDSKRLRGIDTKGARVPILN